MPRVCVCVCVCVWCLWVGYECVLVHSCDSVCPCLYAWCVCVWFECLWCGYDCVSVHSCDSLCLCLRAKCVCVCPLCVTVDALLWGVVVSLCDDYLCPVHKVICAHVCNWVWVPRTAGALMSPPSPEGLLA